MKKDKENATVKTPVNELSEKESIMHYAAIMIEEMKSHNRMVSESMDMKLDALRQEMRRSFDQVNARLDALEAAVSLNSRRISELGIRMDRLETRVDSVEANLSKKIDRLSERFDDHEGRITTLESLQS